MNLKLKTKHLGKSAVCAAGIVLGSCGSGLAGGENSSTKICDIELFRTEQLSNFAGGTSVSYSGTLSSDCQKKTTELTGNA
ncbi:MAG: hypothetical protein ACO3A4_13400, partial [Silvanigrellaceae bacterium]